MRVCQLSHVEQTYNFLAPVFQALDAEGHEVVAACCLEHGGVEVRRHLGDRFALHRVPAARRVTLQALTVDVLRLAGYLRRQRFDVLQVHGPLVALQARCAARLAGVPLVVYQAHGFYFHDGTPPLRRRLLASVERMFCRHLTDVLVTVNEEDTTLARREGFVRDPDDVVHVPGVGIDVQRFRPPGGPDERLARRELRRSLGCTDDDLVVLFVGRIVREKGVVELLTAMEQRWHDGSGARLWLVGDARAGERDTATAELVRELVDRAEVRGRALQLGRRPDVAELLQASDVFVLPSYREGMPVALLEAMASGLPVVTTDVRGCREAVDAGRVGLLVPPRDATAVAEAVGRLEADPGLRARLGGLGRTRVVDTYSCAASTQVQVELYRRLERRLRGQVGTARA